MRLVLVCSDEELRIWNELMLTEHPLQACTLVGRQLRYLINSRHGWLGGFGFSAAALQLEARDQWMGWEPAEQRQIHLHRVIGITRFLIRPSVECKHLASKALSLSVARLAEDFTQRYHYTPYLIESFVDLEHY